MIQDDKDVYYQSVHLFVERVKDFIKIKEDKILRTNLNTCLREKALIWYIVKLIELKRLALRQIDEQWIIMLVKRFRSNQIVAMNALIKKRYILINLQSERELSAYVQIMINHVKDVSFDNHFL